MNRGDLMKLQINEEGMEWAKAFAFGILVFIFIRTFFFLNYVVEGESMLPTLEEGNKLVVNRIGYEVSELKRFDVIVFHANEDEDFVKRVIGLPGEHVEYKQNTLYINGTEIEEPFRKEYEGEFSITSDFTIEVLTGQLKVPKDQLFVLGDNRNESWDSRHFGFISMDQVVGKVNLRYWPINDIDVSF